MRSLYFVIGFYISPIARGSIYILGPRGHQGFSWDIPGEPQTARVIVMGDSQGL